MTEVRFDYDESLVTSCATSPLAYLILEQRDHINTVFSSSSSSSSFQHPLQENDAKSQSCLTLFDLHSQHFHTSFFEEKDINDAEKKDINDADGGSSTSRSLRASSRMLESTNQLEQQERFHNFVRNTVYVHQHNSAKDDSNKRHTLGLNQFSDRNHHKEESLPFAPLDENAMTSLWNFGNLDLGDESIKLDLDLPLEDSPLFHNAFQPPYDETSTKHSPQNVFVRLPTKEAIANASAEFLPHLVRDITTMNHGNHNDVVATTHHRELHKKNHDYKHYKDQQDDREAQLQVKDKKSDLEAKNNQAFAIIGKEGSMKSNEKWKHHINWATDQNPDGIGIVHPPYNQGHCGSCWAFSTTGTLEASLVRRAAYNSFMASTNNTIPSDEQDYEKAVLQAQADARRTLEDVTLSVQELIDCDKSNDQACIGGNPLLAFYFVHLYGLTSWENYPYHGRQEQCQLHKVRQPIVTVQQWGVLPQNAEENLEVVVRDIGPVAVGLYGADSSFVGYRGGIFQNTLCPFDRPLNHAILIVGYGEEIDRATNQKVKYWIARNSWGKGWGEEGYIRIQRNIKGHEHGLCGLAKIPTVALGAQLVGNPKRFHTENSNGMEDEGSYHGDGETIVAPPSYNGEYDEQDSSTTTITIDPPASTTTPPTVPISTTTTANSFTKMVDHTTNHRESRSIHPHNHHTLKKETLPNTVGGGACHNSFDFQCMMEYHRGLLFGLLSLLLVSIMVVLPLSTKCRIGSTGRRRNQQHGQQQSSLDHDNNEEDFLYESSTIATDEPPTASCNARTLAHNYHHEEQGETTSLLKSSSSSSSSETIYHACVDYGSH